MKIIYDVLKGPYKDEAGFKKAMLKVLRQDYTGYTLFEIENEEKEPGMPDVLAMHPRLYANFLEFKYAGKNGVVEFTKAQPLFYKTHHELSIKIYAWDARYKHVVDIKPEEVVEAKSLRITLPEA